MGAAAVALEGQMEMFIPPATQEYAERLRYLRHDAIRPDPDQPRKHPDSELRDSIARNGLIQPITVRPDPARLDEAFLLVDGERRWRAAEGVLAELPCIVREDLDEDLVRLQTQLVANTAKPLDPLEESRALARLAPEHESVTALARAVGKPESSVRERLQLLELGPWVELIEGGKIPLSHAVRVLLPLRACPDEVHAHSVELVMKDYPLTADTNKQATAGFTDFARVVEIVYARAMYPLTKTKTTWHKQPEFDTRKHDEECSCGRIMFALNGDTKRACCGNPAWWKPLHRKAMEANPKKKKRPSPSGLPKITYARPEGATVAKSQHGDTPAGVVYLTDQNHRRWAWQHIDFDPTAVAAELEPKDLVFVETYSGTVVGTKNGKAIGAAREAWATRWADRLTGVRTALGKQLKEKAKAYDVRGAGVAEILVRLVSTEDRRDHTAIAILDIAEALGHELPDAVVVQAGWNKGAVNPKGLAAWLVKQDEKDVNAIATGLAFLLATRTTPPTVKIAEEQEAERKRIAAQPVPWAKAAKGPKPTKGRKTATEPDEAFDDEDEEEEER